MLFYNGMGSLSTKWLAGIKVRTESAARAATGCIVGIANLGGMHTSPGTFSARIADPQCPCNQGIWQLRTVDGMLRSQPGAEADHHLSIQAVSALIPSTHDRADFAFRTWGNPSAEVQRILQAMFPTMLPHLYECFWIERIAVPLTGA
jgi:hypothetical protein